MCPLRRVLAEVLARLEYSLATDVWSFGVLLWEIFAGGEAPYAGMTNAEAMREVLDHNYRMPAPSGTPEPVQQLMAACWQYEAKDRPAMADAAIAFEGVGGRAADLAHQVRIAKKAADTLAAQNVRCPRLPAVEFEQGALVDDVRDLRARLDAVQRRTLVAELRLHHHRLPAVEDGQRAIRADVRGVRARLEAVKQRMHDQQGVVWAANEVQHVAPHVPRPPPAAAASVVLAPGIFLPCPGLRAARWK